MDISKGRGRAGGLELRSLKSGVRIHDPDHPLSGNAERNSRPPALPLPVNFYT